MEAIHEVYNWIVTSILGIGVTIIAWFMNRSINAIDKTIDSHSALLSSHTANISDGTAELLKFKADVAKEYAKEESMQVSLARVHDRIDDVGARVETIGGELTKDIKEILSRLK